MKILLNSIAVDVYLAVIRANVTVDMEGIEESFSFFFPFNADKKPTAAELQEMGESAKSKAFENHFAAKCDLVEEKENEIPVAVAEAIAVPVRRTRGPNKKKSVSEDVPASVCTAPIQEVLSDSPVGQTPALAPVEAVESEVVAVHDTNPLEHVEVRVDDATAGAAENNDSTVPQVDYVAFNRKDRAHADVVGDWFSLANPDWRKTAESIAVCKEIAVAMDGAPFMIKTAEGLVPNEAVKAAAIKSVEEGKPLFN